jgi:hypothetical protein
VFNWGIAMAFRTPLIVAFAAVCTLNLLPFPLAAQTAVVTGHYDNFRTGANTNESILTPANVNATQFGKLARLPVAGCIFAQPLYVPGVVTPNRGARNLVFIATTSNMVYAYDADEYILQWKAGFGTPFPSSVIANYSDFLDCSVSYLDATESGIGIVGTPVIDVAGGTMYFVANTASGDIANPVSHHILHKIRLADGVDMSLPVEIAGTYQGVTFQSRFHLQRTALLLLNSRIYVAFASHHDETPYNGWMFSYDTNLQQVAVMNYAPLKWGAGIWQSGGGPASDGKYIYFNTGNNIEGDADASDNSESILQVDPITLRVLSKTGFFPEGDDWDDNADLDLGSSRVIVMPGTNRVISGSKYGDLFSVNQTGMMLEARQQAVARYSEGLDWTGVYNGFAFWNNTIFVWPGGGGYIYGADPPFPTDTLKGFALSPDFLSIKMLANGQSDGTEVGYQGANIVISANGQNPASGIVWAATPILNTAAIQPGYLHAYSASDFSKGIFHELWNNALDRFDNDVACSHAKFNQPLIANGKVFLPTASQRVLVYGLLPAQRSAHGPSPTQGPTHRNSTTFETQVCSPIPNWLGQ